MDRAAFEAELKSEGYDVMTNTTPGVKVNPEHSHPYDVKVMVVQGALTLASEGKVRTYKAGETFSLPCLYTRGPNAVRTKDAAARAVAILLEHNWLEKLDGSHIVDGQRRRDCYRLRSLEA